MTNTAIVLSLMLVAQVGPSKFGTAQSKSPGVGSRYGAPAAAIDNTDQDNTGDGSAGKSGTGKGWATNPSPDARKTKNSQPKRLSPGAPGAAKSPAGSSFPSKTLFPQDKAPADENSDSSLVAIPPNTESVPALLIRRALTPPAEGALPGESVTLTQLLGKDALGQRHMDLVRSYYRLCGAVADYHYALDEYKRLTISVSRVDAQHAVLDTAIASALARVQQSKLEAVQAQHDLAKHMRSPINAPLPLPGDKPLVGPYRAYFKELYASRGATWTDARRAKEISDTLPLALDAIRETANSSSSTKELLIETNRQFKLGNASPLDLLASHLQMREQRKAFVRAVRDYNLAIAEYAILVAPNGSQAASLLPMLVRRPAPQPLSNVYPPPGGGSTAPAFEPKPAQPAVAAGFEDEAPLGQSDTSDLDEPDAETPAGKPALDDSTSGEVESQPQEPAKFSVPAEPVKRLRSVVVPSRRKQP